MEDTPHHQKKGDTVSSRGKQEPVLHPTISSPPSASSSPSHEFSFTISLHSSSTIPDKARSPPIAIDLSPADEIFFHGHLLPLHLLSHLPISPRSSTNSPDSFTLPIRDLFEDGKSKSNCSSSIINAINDDDNNNKSHHNNTSETKGRGKLKSFHLFGLTRWRKGSEVREREEGDQEKKKRRRLRFDLSHILKRYVRIVRPLLLFRGGKKETRQFPRQPYSFSGNLNSRGKQSQWTRGGRREFSAPASMSTSPTNSGLLVATAALPSATSDSTMEELQAAIQAAIAHCKNSISMKEEKLKS